MVRPVLLLLLVLIASDIAAKARLIISYESKENPPYYMGVGPQVSADYPGISVELINEIALKLGVEVIYRRTPWQRGLFMLSNNHIDAIFHASYNEERRNIGYYPMKDGVIDASRSIMPQSYFFYVKKPAPFSWSGQNFSSIKERIGAVIGYAVVDLLREKQVDVVEVRSQVIGLRMLQYGRINGFAGLENMVDLQLQKHPDEFTDIEKITPPIMTKNYYLLFSKRFYRENTELAERIWDQMKVFRENGRYQEIANKYKDKLN
ncbi:substrate-binding periplasmic protein [Alkalimarinus coralli]|uniref:substrate-binding periplasmic protein n=1 Tax=Alkalimarinus coralli TaxID=2935863 RepID=UPI00202B37B7|nr:transporter substrate-binding domain-containing protein [Alkalimarinus coralli]